jgi:hypothetical protein
LIIIIEGMNQQTLKCKLFPFSLVGGAKKWYYSSVGSMEGSWDKLREKFCLTFFSMSRVVTLRLEILSFKQLDKESLGTAWARFTNSLASGPDIGIPEPILLQHFRMGLDDLSAKFLDTSSGGLFTHLTLNEGKDVLGKILENNPYTEIFDEFPDEGEEPMPTTLSKPKPIEGKLAFPTIQSVKDCTPLTKTWFTDEPFQPYQEVYDPSCDFVYEFYDELFADFGNTWNYRRVERPKAREKLEILIPNTEEVERRRQSLEYVSAMSSREWLRETEVMDQVILLYHELKLLSCQVGNFSYQDVFYDSRVGINIIPKSLVLEAFPDEPLSFSQKRVRWISGETIETEAILRVIQTKIGEYGIFLDYHIFDIPKGDPPFILIRRPI